MKTITLERGDWYASHEKKPLELLNKCGGYYECPKDTQGKRVGPLVGYAGRDSEGRQYVGDVYVNFAKAERHAPILRHFANNLNTILKDTNDVFLKMWIESTGFCAAPEGGKALAVMLANQADKQYIFPEKKIKALSTPTSREISELVFDRHEPDKGDSWWIVEDVCNNFSTTAKLVDLIESFGAKVLGVLCFLNRSLEIEDTFITRPDKSLSLPVISIVQQKIMQYKQDDPEVTSDIKAGNVIWKPKNEWDRLAAAMKQ